MIKENSMDEQRKYNAADNTVPAISDAALLDNIEECYSQFRRICESWHRGYLTRETVEDEFRKVFWKGFFHFIEDCGLLIQLKWTDWNNGIRFADDYQMWKNGERPCSTRGSIWLADRGGRLRGGKEYGEEASCSDKIQFFRLMEAFNMPPEYFQTFPEGTVCPDVLTGREPQDLLIGWKIWDDDGGLLSDSFQLGDTVTLTDHYGLKSFITITEHLASNEEKRSRRISEDYIGAGTIEGYTTSRSRQIRIGILDGKIRYLHTTSDNEDRELFDSFPLWSNAREYGGKIIETREKALRSLIERFMNEKQ